MSLRGLLSFRWELAVGDKVLLSFTSCGSCEACDSAHPAYCETWLPRKRRRHQR